MKGVLYMTALATCKFPLVDQWKEAADKNPVLGFADSFLSGYGQIGFNDNPVSGLLFIIGCFVGSAQNGICSLICAFTATLMGYLLGVPRISMRLGLYTFNAALAGMGVGLFIFTGQTVITAGMVLFCVICGIICVFLTAAFSAVLSKWNVPSLALPYCTALLIMVSASLFVSSAGPTTSVIPHLGEMKAFAAQSWTAADLFTSFMNNFSEILWQANPVSGAFFLAGVIIASRIDFVSIIAASAIATATAVALNLPVENNMIGIYGYNAVLLTMIIFGRGFAISIASTIYAVVLAVVSVIFTACLATVFSPLGFPVAAFPYAIMAVLAMLGKDAFKRLTPVDPMLWGVPETIRKAMKQN